MDKVLNPRSLRLSRYSLGRFNVHRIKCLVSPLNVKADSIYHCISTSNGSSDSSFVANVRLDQLQTKIIDAE